MWLFCMDLYLSTVYVSMDPILVSCCSTRRFALGYNAAHFEYYGLAFADRHPVATVLLSWKLAWFVLALLGSSVPYLNC